MNVFKSVRLPSFSQWQKFPKLLSQKEKFILVLLFLLFLGSGIGLVEILYYKHTVVAPSRGGQIREGVIGSPRFLNPVLSDANDIDRDLVQLLFAGLMKYNAKEEIVPDLAENVTVQEGGKTFEVTLKENLKWSDGLPINADDVILTIQTIQDPKYKSPIRANWIGVDLEKISDTKLVFRLPQPYAPFEERLTIKLIPSHIWKQITPENFALSGYNLQPVVSGPYRVSQVSRDKSGPVSEINLAANAKYHGQHPYISELSFIFFENEKQIQNAYNRGEIQSFAVPSLRSFPGLEVHKFSLPRYFAVFFNVGSKDPQDPVRKKEVRQALELATNKTELIKKLFEGQGKLITSPLLPETLGIKNPESKESSEENILGLLSKAGYTKTDGKIVKMPQSADGLTRDLQQGSQGADVKKLQECLARDPEIYPEGTISGVFGSVTKTAVIKFQQKHAAEILTPQGLTEGTGKAGGATRDKLNQICFTPYQDLVPLALTLSTIDQSPLREAAETLKGQWEQAGFTVQVQTQSPATLERDTIKPRSYQALLFGEILGKIADPFPFWHSSQKRDPGLNLSAYENKKLDTLLEQARKEIDEGKRKELYEQMQDILVEDTPAIVLYDIDYLYATPRYVHGIESGKIVDPSQRFADIHSWYIKTKRTWK